MGGERERESDEGRERWEREEGEEREWETKR